MGIGSTVGSRGTRLLHTPGGPRESPGADHPAAGQRRCQTSAIARHVTLSLALLLLLTPAGLASSSPACPFPLQERGSKVSLHFIQSDGWWHMVSAGSRDSCVRVQGTHRRVPSLWGEACGNIYPPTLRHSQHFHRAHRQPLGTTHTTPRAHPAVTRWPFTIIVAGHTQRTGSITDDNTNRADTPEPQTLIRTEPRSTPTPSDELTPTLFYTALTLAFLLGKCFHSVPAGRPTLSLCFQTTAMAVQGGAHGSQPSVFNPPPPPPPKKKK